MDSFRTVVRVTPAPLSIGLNDGVLTVGSCFADAIGNRLVKNKFRTLANPFGVIYNPLSIHKALNYATGSDSLNEHSYVQQGEVFLNYDFHSELSALRKNDLENRIRERLGTVRKMLKDTRWVLLTYGTAWVYRRKDTGEVVANCHKIPAEKFSKSLLTIEEIKTSFQTLIRGLLEANPDIRILLTVSPVRHIKDTLALNTVSKSILRIACHQLEEEHAAVEYFPAYEMMIDDLRDYRFYQPDMLHPTDQAEEYIWEKFSKRYFAEETQRFLARWNGILQNLSHKPFHPTTSDHQQFLRETKKKLEELKPLVNVDEEIASITKQLNE